MVNMKLLDLNTTTQACNFCQLNSLTATVLSFPRKAWMKCCFYQQLKDIDERLRVLEDVKSTLDIQLKTTNEARNELITGSGSGYMDAVEAVGINNEVEQIARMIVGDVQMKVITIWGGGGSGKTTLAKQVYEKVKYGGNIDCCSWVDVNHSSDIVYVLRETIKGINKSVGTKRPPELELEKADRNSLQQHIRDYLKGKRYALFFYDVWDHNLLTQINIPNSGASSIIITARDKNIAVGSFLGAAPHYVEVKPLEFESACNLFCKLAFRNNAGGGICSWPDDTIKGLGEALVKKCSGLPVAILAMAGMMSAKGTDDPGKWSDALESLDKELLGSIKTLNRAVLLSYNELPTHLKSCFLYCAMFPKTHEISVEKLIPLCIAEGFINEDGGTTLEEIGKNYFLQLKYRSLLQFEEELGRIEMHDLYREVACEVIRSEMFCEIILDHSKTKPAEWKKQRRLLILDDKVKLDNNNYENMKKLRTLLISCDIGEQIPLSSISFPQMLKNIKLLKVLVLQGLPDDIKEVPNEVGDLIHLRYFSLRSLSISCLPDSFGRLHNLQTLDLRNCLYVKNLPNSVSELKQLRHLFGFELQVADTVFTFPHLQTLSGIRISNINQATELSNITQLTELYILSGEEEIWRAICASLQKMNKLRSLSITLMSCLDSDAWEFGDFSPPLHLKNLTLQLFGKLVKFTTTLNFLREMTLQVCEVDEDFFSSLEKLPSLVFLFIGYYSGEKLFCSDRSFPKLKELIILCENVSKWEIGKAAMKCLHSLIMYNCISLQMLPEGLRQLESLKEIDLYNPSQQLVQRISVGGPDRFNVNIYQ